MVTPPVRPLPSPLLLVSTLSTYTASTNTNSQPQQPPTHNPVSWQTAFWTLLALALNAMTQNSTFDRDFPSGVLFPAHSSPLVCAVDALEVFLQLIGYMYVGASAPAAARRVVQERMWQPPRSISVATAADPPLTLGDQHPRAHIVLFVLGVLPQAIKLFGMHGIPWTQACGGLYLSSYLVIAGVGALARRVERDTDADTSWRRAALVERTMKVWNFVSFGIVAVVQAGVWVWCVQALLLPVWDIEAKAFVLYFILSFLKYLVFGLMICMSNILPFLLVFATPVIPTTRGQIAYFAFSISLGVGLCVYGVPLFQVADLLFRMDYLLFSVYVLLAAFIATKVVPHHRLMIFFGLLNLVLSILYYRFRYDPTGTVKPLWAEKLG